MPSSKKDYKKLVKLEKYDGYFINPASGKITCRRTINGRPEIIRTGVVGKINPKTGAVDGISKAKEIVEIEVQKILTGKSESVIRREQSGVVNPFLGALYEELCILKLPGKETGTEVNYKKAWKRGMAGFWEKKTCLDLHERNIALYKLWYLENHPLRLFDKTFDFFKMFLKFLVSRNYIAAIPDFSELNDLDEIIKKNKQYTKAGRVYTKSEEVALLNSWEKLLGGSVGGTTSVHKKVLAARGRLAVRLGLRCGMRASEVFKAKKENVFLKEKYIMVWSFKNHKWRQIPLIDEVIEAIKYQLDANSHFQSEWLFPSPKNPKTHITAQVLAKIWYKMRKLSGIPVAGKLDARFHDLRKTFATMTADLGWPWKTACEILDMSGEVYERVYANSIRFESKANLMNAAFNNAPEVGS